MILDKNKAYKNLKKKGFTDAIHKSGDHLYLELWHNNERILYTKISHGSKKDLDLFLIKQMAKQCELSKEEFANLVNCPLSQEAYITILKEKGILD
jgi:predicted RNA binding protein YcfA (HicA-like mRNA interferase family)